MDPGTIISIVQITGSALKCLADTAKDLKDAPNSLAIVTIETDKLHLQMERLLVAQQMLPADTRTFLDKQVSTLECRATVQKLVDLTVKIKPHDKMELGGRFKWLWNRSKVEELLSDLRKEIDRLSRLLTPEQLNQLVLTTNQILGVSNLMDEKIERLLESVSHLRLSDASASLTTPSFDQDGIYWSHHAVGITWHGQWRCKPGQDFSMPYFRDRCKLADAALIGDWATVRRTLQHAETAYKQRWHNTTRIYAATESNVRQSGFTALHQAAYHGNKPAVEELVRSGAWRLVRTHRENSSSAKYSTPLDVARSLGWDSLLEVLSPVVRRTVRPIALQRLQDRLHKLIRDEFGGIHGAHLACFNFPELEILTEFDRSRLWFPLNPELLDTRDGLSVHIVLDGNELVVSLRRGRSHRKNFSISETETKQIEQAMVLS